MFVNSSNKIFFDSLPVIFPHEGCVVEARGEGSEAQILAWAYNSQENTADTVICAPGKVRVLADQGSEARIKSRAGWRGDAESINKATTQIYASDVKVDVSSLYPGQGIWAYAEGAENPRVPAHYCMTVDGEVALTDGDAVLIIQDYSNRKDCPECPDCPCGGGEVPAPVAPLAQFATPRIEGCPGLMLAAAMQEDPTTKNIPVIFLTCLTKKTQQIGSPYYDAAKYAFIAKPYDLDKLPAEIDRLIGARVQ